MTWDWSGAKRIAPRTNLNAEERGKTQAPADFAGAWLKVASSLPPAAAVVVGRRRLLVSATCAAAARCVAEAGAFSLKFDKVRAIFR